MTDWVAFGVFAVLLAALVVVLTRRSALLLDDVSLSARQLLANTAGTQAMLALGVVGAMFLADVPLRVVRPGVTAGAVGVGVVAGLLIAAGNEAAVRLLDVAGVAYDESARDALTPETVAGWLFLLVVALPVVAGFEELLFRGVLVGALATGFGVSLWVLAAASSVAFGAAHTAQGNVGVVVTTLLGVALAAVFVLTDSLLAAVVAHYVVNAVEFVVHAR